MHLRAIFLGVFCCFVQWIPCNGDGTRFNLPIIAGMIHSTCNINHHRCKWLYRTMSLENITIVTLYMFQPLILANCFSRLTLAGPNGRWNAKEPARYLSFPISNGPNPIIHSVTMPNSFFDRSSYVVLDLKSWVMTFTRVRIVSSSGLSLTSCKRPYARRQKLI